MCPVAKTVAMLVQANLFLTVTLCYNYTIFNQISMLLYATYVTNLARLPLLIKGQSYDITYYIITQWCKDEVRLLGVCRHFKQFFIEIS